MKTETGRLIVRAFVFYIVSSEIRPRCYDQPEILTQGGITPVEFSGIQRDTLHRRGNPCGIVLTIDGRRVGGSVFPCRYTNIVLPFVICFKKRLIFF